MNSYAEILPNLLTVVYEVRKINFIVIQAAFRKALLPMHA